MSNWDDKAKRLLKSELVKRGVSHTDLVLLLNEIGVEETKAGIDSKISRGSFSATFLLQCLTVIGCQKIEIEDKIFSIGSFLFQRKTILYPCFIFFISL